MILPLALKASDKIDHSPLQNARSDASISSSPLAPSTRISAINIRHTTRRVDDITAPWPHFSPRRSHILEYLAAISSYIIDGRWARQLLFDSRILHTFMKPLLGCATASDIAVQWNTTLASAPQERRFKLIHAWATLLFIHYRAKCRRRQFHRRCRYYANAEETRRKSMPTCLFGHGAPQRRTTHASLSRSGRRQQRCSLSRQLSAPRPLPQCRRA